MFNVITIMKTAAWIKANFSFFHLECVISCHFLLIIFQIWSGSCFYSADFKFWYSTGLGPKPHVFFD